MRATFTQEQREVEQAVRDIVGTAGDGARAALDAPWSPPAIDRELLSGFGVLGVPESAGGVGSSLIDLLVAVEVLGETLAPSRFPWHAIAVQLMTAGPTIDEAVLGGERVLTPAVDLPRGHAHDSLERTLVPYAAAADAFVVASADGVWCSSALARRERESFDPSVPLSDVEFGDPGDATAWLGRGKERAALVAAAQLCGVAQGAIELAAEQARTRHQFGKAIGSFQGVAFQLADAVTARKAAWDLTLYAAWAVENDRDDASSHVHAAKAAAGKAAVFAAERCIQVHGGMGITMATDPHLYLRRAFVLDAMLGSGAAHRRQVGRLRVDARS